MKVYSLTGKSGTGTSYRAISLSQELNIEAIIDDGLFIYRNVITAGVSAKRQDTKMGAMKTALFLDEKERDDIKRAISDKNPSSILVLATSEKMALKIAEALSLGDIPEGEITEEESGKMPQSIDEVITRLQEIVEDPTNSPRQELEQLKQAFYRMLKNRQEKKLQEFVQEGGNAEDFKPEQDPQEEQYKKRNRKTKLTKKI